MTEGSNGEPDAKSTMIQAQSSKRKTSSAGFEPPPIDPKDALFLFQSMHAEADKLAVSGFYEEAVNRYTRALEIQATHAQNNSEGNEGGGNNKANEGGYSIHLVPDPDCLVNRSRCFMMLGNITAALTDVEKALSVDPNFIRALFQKAEVLYAKGDFEEALVLYHRGRKARPELEGFYVGVVKSTEAIKAAIALLDPSKLREKRQKQKEEALASSLPNKVATPSGPKRNGATKPSPNGAKQDLAGLAASYQPAEKDPHERNLLEELYEDKQFLEEIYNDNRFMQACNGEIKCLVEEALAYMDTRVDFWRQRNPSGVSAAVMNAAEQGSLKHRRLIWGSKSQGTSVSRLLQGSQPELSSKVVVKSPTIKQLEATADASNSLAFALKAAGESRANLSKSNSLMNQK
jgi:tetratricopeptide (TPR) repeat protein